MSGALATAAWRACIVAWRGGYGGSAVLHRGNVMNKFDHVVVDSTREGLRGERSSLGRRAPRVAGLAVGAITAILCAGCARPTPTTDPAYVAAAAQLDKMLLGLEVTGVGIGFMAGREPGSVPSITLPILETGFRQAFGGCATTSSNTMTGELSLDFAAGGCALPEASTRVFGGLTIRSMESMGTTTLGLAFRNFAITNAPTVNGSITVRFIDGSTLEGTFGDFSITHDGSTPIRIAGTMRVAASRFNTIVEMNINGSAMVDGQSLTLRSQNLSRHLLADCFPESGMITIQVPTGATTTEATFEFEDAETSLDSDDTGLAYLTLNAQRKVVQLRSRACLAL